MIHWQKTLADKEIGIILLTEKFGRNSRTIMDDVKLNHKMPLIIEILTVTVPAERRTFHYLICK